jgi:hypothetical protein
MWYLEVAIVRWFRSTILDWFQAATMLCSCKAGPSPWGASDRIRASGGVVKLSLPQCNDRHILAHCQDVLTFVTFVGPLIVMVCHN